jgi:hypothetical protein
VSVSISKATPTVTLNGSHDPADVADVILTARVYHSGAGKRPLGTVAFYYDGAEISGCGAVSLAEEDVTTSAATCNVSHPGAGRHAYKAVYSGEAGYYESEEEEIGYDIDLIDQAALAIAAVTGKRYGDAPFDLALSAEGSGTGGLTYSTASATVLSVTAAGEVTILAAGEAQVKVIKAADAFYNSEEAELDIAIGRKQIGMVPAFGGLVYDGTEQEGVQEGEGYSISGNKATLSPGRTRRR